MTKSQPKMWHQICWVQFRLALPTATQRPSAQNTAKIAAKRSTRIVTSNACGIVAKKFVLTTVLRHAVQQRDQHKSRRKGQHLHHLRLDQAFALGLLITRATRLDNPSAAAIMAAATAQAMIPCATTIRRGSRDGTIVRIHQITIATPMAAAHLAASRVEVER